MAINGVIRHPMRLDRCEPSSGKALDSYYRAWRLGTGKAFQVAPDLAGICCGMRPEGMGGPDYVDGASLILFRDLAALEGADIIPLANNDILGDPASGEACMVMKHGLWIWFVPAGARRADGSAHPHAGTGFGLQTLLEVPVGPDLRWRQGDLYNNVIRRTAIYAFEFNDQGFHIRDTRVCSRDDMPICPSHPITHQMLAVAVQDRERFRWRLSGAGLGPAIPDGDGMLMPAMAERPVAPGQSATNIAAGVMRWACEQGRWRPVHFNPIAISVDEVEQFWHEPSLVRNPDGSLLFSARPRFGPYVNTIRLWHSTDTMIWRVMLDHNTARTESPVTINTALDGSPYFALNPWLPGYADKSYTYGRRRLDIVPLTPDFSGLRDGMTVREAPEDPQDGKWLLDHPLSATVRLKGGQWRHLLVYRAFFQGPLESLGKAGLQYGTYVDEIESDGPVRPAWRFDA